MHPFKFRPRLDTLGDRITPASAADVYNAILQADAPAAIFQNITAHPFELSVQKDQMATAMTTIAIQATNNAAVLSDFLGSGTAQGGLSATAAAALAQTQSNVALASAYAMGFGGLPPSVVAEAIRVASLPPAPAAPATTAATVAPPATTGSDATNGSTIANASSDTPAQPDGSTGATDGNGTVATSTGTTATVPTAAPTQDDSGMSDTIPSLSDPGFTTQSDGLRIRDVVVGTGDTVPTGGDVNVFYTGWTLDGKVFDSDRANLSSRPSAGQPTNFNLNSLIKGFQEGIPGMKAGGIRQLYVPYQLAYGDAGNPPSIPPQADLVFEVKVLSTGIATTS